MSEYVTVQRKGAREKDLPNKKKHTNFGLIQLLQVLRAQKNPEFSCTLGLHVEAEVLPVVYNEYLFVLYKKQMLLSIGRPSPQKSLCKRVKPFVKSFWERHVAG